MEQSEIYPEKEFRGNVEQAKEFVQRNLRDIKSADEVAEAVGVPYEYLRKVFRRQLGRTIWEYVEEMRIEHAKLLLETTHWKCYRIASEVGLKDEVLFAKFFKRMLGITPKEYRLKCWNAQNGHK